MPCSWRDTSHIEELTGVFEGHGEKEKEENFEEEQTFGFYRKEIYENDDRVLFLLTSKIDLQFWEKIPCFFV